MQRLRGRVSGSQAKDCNRAKKALGCPKVMVSLGTFVAKDCLPQRMVRAIFSIRREQQTHPAV